MKKKRKAGSTQAIQIGTKLQDKSVAKEAPRSRSKQSWWYALGFLAFVGIAVAGVIVLPDYLFKKGKDLPGKDYVRVKDRAAPKLNPKTPPGPAPEGMVWVPGGEFYMGIDPEAITEETPTPERFTDALHVHKVYVDGFWMDATEVTNEEFARFVAATNYVTVAERRPEPRDFPGVPVDKIPKDPCSIVFKKPKPGDPVDLRDELTWQHLVTGASWKHPEGPGSDVSGRGKHPVAHICWEDAVAYCKWAKKRLPTEAEWEFAARGGLDRKFYVWGDDKTPGDKWLCNCWQGRFPVENSTYDGHEGASPVKSYPPNGYGLYDMVGNVWEWCADYYQPNYYEESPERNPKGPISGWDPSESGIAKRVQRGGSFLCADNYCMRYLPGARGKGEPRSAALHIGFRCVREAGSAAASKE